MTTKIIHLTLPYIPSKTITVVINRCLGGKLPCRSLGVSASLRCSDSPAQCVLSVFDGHFVLSGLSKLTGSNTSCRDVAQLLTDGEILFRSCGKCARSLAQRSQGVLMKN